MSSTESQLLAVHKAPTVKLEDICEHYLGLSPTVAKQYAAKNQLPVTTFRLTSSAKAPLMVKISDLAALIDSQHAGANHLHADLKETPQARP